MEIRTAPFYLRRYGIQNIFLIFFKKLKKEREIEFEDLVLASLYIKGYNWTNNHRLSLKIVRAMLVCNLEVLNCHKVIECTYRIYYRKKNQSNIVLRNYFGYNCFIIVKSHNY